MRECTCDNFVTGEPWVRGRDCWLCWLYSNSPAYKNLWDSMPERVEQPAKPRTPEEQQKLTFAARLANFARAMVREAKWLADGGKPPTVEEKAKRREICNACELRDVSDDSCKKCGCYLEAGLFPPRPLGKLGAATQSCPLRLWGTTGGAKAEGCGG